MQDYGYWRIKAKCVQCQLHFLICTLKPDQHDGLTLHCPECGQHGGQFIVWREEVRGSTISQEVPGNHSGKWEHPRPTPRRSWFAVWRWKWWTWAVIAVVWLVVYPLSIGPAVWLENSGYLPTWIEYPLALCYMPLMLIAASIQPVEDVFSWYIELWR